MHISTLVHTIHCKHNSFKNLRNIIFRKGLSIRNALKQLPALQQLHHDHRQRHLHRLARDAAHLCVNEDTRHLNHPLYPFQTLHQVDFGIDFFQLGAAGGVSKELKAHSRAYFNF